MWRLPTREDCVVWLHRILLLILQLWQLCNMSLSRNETFKWIRKRFSRHRQTPDTNSNTDTERGAGCAGPPLGAVTENAELAVDGHLSEILVLNDTQIVGIEAAASATSSPPPGALHIDMDCNEAKSVGRCNDCGRTAPIARDEDVEEMELEQSQSLELETIPNANYVCCQYNVATKIPTTATSLTSASASNRASALPRSKSRVRTYFKRCKQRLTGQQQLATAASTKIKTPTTTTTTITMSKNEAVVAPTPSQVQDQVMTKLTEIDSEESDTPSSYTEALPLDLGLNATPPTLSLSTSSSSATSACYKSLAIDAQQAVVQQAPMCPQPQETVASNTCDLTTTATETTFALDRTNPDGGATDAGDSPLAELIDRHLSHIYPVYWRRTRAILIRQARDVLVCAFHGCLEAFEQRFLCKFAKIAAILRATHQIGESWLWHAGWPLATHNGALVLHLSAAESAHALRSAELYLCVKLAETAEAANEEEPQEPELYAVWQRNAVVQSCCIDYNDPKTLPLSVLQLEKMLGFGEDGGELPQLLQNLLVSVERSIERVSLNELQMPLANAQQHCEELDESNNNNSNNNNNNNNNIGSPKCALRRSDLITKNKLFNNRYMLRRLTNRQDSMNSTSSGNSCNSNASSVSNRSSLGEELLGHVHNSNNNNNNHNNNDLSINNTQKSTSPALPLFCLGNSFPHIDSDEEAADIGEKCHQMDAATELLPPSSISELPEKLLTSGVYLPGTRTLKGDPLVSVDAGCVLAAGLNCYELATLLLYYSTIPERSHVAAAAAAADQLGTTGHKCNEEQPAQQTFTILIAIEKSQHLCVIDLICQSLKLLSKQIGYCEILAVCLERNLLQLCNEQQPQQQKQSISKNSNDHNGNNNNNQHLEQASSVTSAAAAAAAPNPPPAHLVKFISVDEVTTSVAPSQLPCHIIGDGGSHLRGQHYHDARKWREFFTQLEAFQRQCAAAGQRLVSALSDIRSADLQGLPNRRQLYGQHRALSRALMDSELHNLRKRGAATLTRLQEMATAINVSANIGCGVGAPNNNMGNYSGSNLVGSTTTTTATATAGNVDAIRGLRKVTLLFNEVDRAAQRLEQLTEQRRERLRELTRQRALEDEINEVTSWLTRDGAETLQKFAQLHWDNETQFKAQEQEFENYYFISMKHLAKGRDLHAAANNMAVLSESANNLKAALDNFAERLEKTHERMENTARLLHLLTQHSREDAIHEDIQRLAEHLGATTLLEKYRIEKPAVKKSASLPIASSTPAPSIKHAQRSSYRSSSGNGSFEGVQSCNCWRESRNLEDMDELLAATAVVEEDGEEEQSKIADSGVGVCERCEGNPKLARICSCQSLNEANNVYDKSHNCDELDDECFERPTKRYMDMHSPMEANAHLQCHASSLELPKLEELSCLEPKIQKTLLLIMREMIGTERDYVRSLYYVIENYIDELLRDDIPQPLRGQRNVIFGNIEKIFEFHNSHFLSELERYERNPLKVGAAFLEMESKFYLYALYNKNKPKSDTLLSEYGSSFFKAKQLELQDKMDLASYLLKPVQRMGKYALLLQQLVKACNSVEGAAQQEIAADVEELHRAEEMVKFQLRHGNDLLAMDSLRDCDVNVKEQGRLLRQNEFLVWQGRGGKKTLRQVFLFEELVLFSKARRFPDHKNLDIYIYKNSIKTSDIGLTAHTGDSPTKFEIWFRKRKPDDTWMLQCMSEDIKNAWTEEISKLLWKQAKRNREIRLAEMSSMGIGSKPCLDIRPSNNQINDRSIPLTQLNKTPKLRHAEPGKGSMRRPNSLISESSLSSGTSSSSISTSSGGGGHESAGRHSLHFGKLHSSLSSSSNSNNNNSATLELINETQALKLKSVQSAESTTSSSSQNNNNSNRQSGKSTHSRHHKRSTTIVSQLSMESGIVSDISVTPDQEHAAEHHMMSSKASATSWSASTTSTTSASTVILRRYKSYAHAAESAAPDLSGK